jgi:hypothetical protein
VPSLLLLLLVVVLVVWVAILPEFCWVLGAAAGTKIIPAPLLQSTYMRNSSKLGQKVTLQGDM